MKCNTCNQEYYSNGCAASLYVMNGDFYILAHYGSAYDMQKYALKRDKYMTGNICDECIKKYIQTGKAYLIEDGVW